MFGYILSGSTQYNVGFFLWGNGGDGKSTCAHILKLLVGEAQTCVLEFDQLDDRFSSYALTENKLNLVEELTVGENKSLSGAEKTFKEITGGSAIKIEKKYGGISKAVPTARCVFATNELPPFVDRSNGLWDRLVFLPFLHRFRDTPDENINLKQELEAELPGIFNWAIEGMRKLKKKKRFPLPEKSKELLYKHRLSCDHEREFMNEFLTVSPQSTVTKADVYESYREWCARSGYRSVAQNKFNQALRRTFSDAVKEVRLRCPKDLMGWQGISLKKIYYGCFLPEPVSPDQSESSSSQVTSAKPEDRG